jgi:integrase
MANRSTVLVWNCKTEQGWRRYPALIGKNGRVRKGIVLIDGVEKTYPEGRFQVRYFEGERTVYENAGQDASFALAMRDRLAQRKEIIADAKGAGIAVQEDTSRMAIGPAIDKYLQRCRDMEANEAVQTYGVALDDLVVAVPSLNFVDEINADTMVKFGVALRKKRNSQRTVFNKHRAVLGFLRWCGADVKALKISTPKFEKKVPRMYTDEQIAALLKAAPDGYFRLVLEVLRMTGLRDQEAVHLGWHQIDFKRKLILVRSSPEWGFRIKDKEERDVPLPDKLAVLLKAWKKKRGGRKLVLSKDRDVPYRHWLRDLKKVARDAGLNCGVCEGCKKKHRQCRKYTLHSYRRAYATALHRKGIGVRDIMQLLGHADIATTMAYLAPMEAQEAHKQVNAAFS